jgi:hypothetical protein
LGRSSGGSGSSGRFPESCHAHNRRRLPNVRRTRLRPLDEHMLRTKLPGLLMTDIERQVCASATRPVADCNDVPGDTPTPRPRRGAHPATSALDARRSLPRARPAAVVPNSRRNSAARPRHLPPLPRPRPLSGMGAGRWLRRRRPTPRRRRWADGTRACPTTTRRTVRGVTLRNALLACSHPSTGERRSMDRGVLRAPRTVVAEHASAQRFIA